MPFHGSRNLAYMKTVGVAAHLFTHQLTASPYFQLGRIFDLLSAAFCIFDCATSTFSFLEHLVLQASIMSSNGKLVMGIPLPHKSALDPPVFEPSPLIYTIDFWALGFFVVLNGLWVKEQFDQYIEIERQSRNLSAQSPNTTNDASVQRSRRRFFWLQPHITSRTRQLSAILAAGVVLPIILLELKWLSTVGWEFSRMAFCKACAEDNEMDREVGTRTILLWCLPTVSILVFMWSWFFLRAVIWFFTQLSFVLQLWSLRPENPLDLNHTPA